MYFDTSFSNIQPSIRNMKIIGMTCVMTMHIIVPLKKIVKYFGGITIDALVHEYASHVIVDVIYR